MKFRLSTNSNSVINAGLTDDYKKAIAEYIWNGFDAGATCVEIRYHANELGGMDDLFLTFEHRENFILDKLNFDKQVTKLKRTKNQEKVLIV